MKEEGSREKLEEFERFHQHLIATPGDIPEIDGLEFYGGVIPYEGTVGGDHIAYIDFKKRHDLLERRRSILSQNKRDLAEVISNGLLKRYDFNRKRERNLKASREEITDLVEDAIRKETLEPLIKKLDLNNHRAGVLILDVAGHDTTDADIAGQMHQAFFEGEIYEMDYFAQITEKLFETLNSRFFVSSITEKNVVMLYAEISSNGLFRFIDAGNPPPVVFSNEFNTINQIGLVSYALPIGLQRSYNDHDSRRYLSTQEKQRLPGENQPYVVNEKHIMMPGDILILHTDGLSDHCKGEYFPRRVEEILRGTKHSSCKDIFYAIKDDLLRYERLDDISYVLVKRKT